MHPSCSMHWLLSCAIASERERESSLEDTLRMSIADRDSFCHLFTISATSCGPLGVVEGRTCAAVGLKQGRKEANAAAGQGGRLVEGGGRLKMEWLVCVRMSSLIFRKKIKLCSCFVPSGSASNQNRPANIKKACCSRTWILLNQAFEGLEVQSLWTTGVLGQECDLYRLPCSAWRWWARVRFVSVSAQWNILINVILSTRKEKKWT